MQMYWLQWTLPKLRMFSFRLIAQCAGVAVAICCSGCFGGDKLNCEDPSFYGTSQSVPPVRVPDGLDVPDESESLQIPPGEPLVVRTLEEMTECLETPPDFFAEEEDDG